MEGGSVSGGCGATSFAPWSDPSTKSDEVGCGASGSVRTPLVEDAEVDVFDEVAFCEVAPPLAAGATETFCGMENKKIPPARTRTTTTIPSFNFILLMIREKIAESNDISYNFLNGASAL